MSPSSRKLPQYRADVTALLLVTHDLLLSCGGDGGDTDVLFRPSSSSSFAREVHAKCSVLAAALAVVGCPIQVTDE